jgi:hypothetical protein
MYQVSPVDALCTRLDQVLSRLEEERAGMVMFWPRVPVLRCVRGSRSCCCLCFALLLFANLFVSADLLVPLEG